MRWYRPYQRIYELLATHICGVVVVAGTATAAAANVFFIFFGKLFAECQI